MASLKGWRRGWLITALIMAPGACSDEGDAGSSLDSFGGEDEPCYPNETCNAGLVCDDGRCVDDGGTGGASGAGNGAVGGMTAEAGESGSPTAGSGGAAVAGSGDGGSTGEGLGGARPVEPNGFRPMPNSPASGLPNPASYDYSTPGLVVDQVTGLIWQSTLDATQPKNQAAAITYCSDFIRAGFTDWRLPSRIELVSLVDFHAQTAPMIDTTAFPETPGILTWTSSVFPDQPVAGQWKVNFERGFVTWRYDGYPTRVRCVRGEEWTVSLSAGTGDREGTVLDATTGLTWEQGASPGMLEWPDAQAYCSTLELASATDWRLPSVNELQLIVDESKAGTLSYDLFSDDPQLNDNIQYWTSTPDPQNGTGARIVQFLSGEPSVDVSTAKNRVRCVRP